MQEHQETVILRLPDVQRMTGLPKSTLYYYMARGQFPRNHKLGYRIVGWLHSDVEAWLQEKINRHSK